MKHIKILICLLFLISCYGKKPQKSGKENMLIPEFKILLSDSITSQNMSKVPYGKSIVLIYFSPYCPFCKSQTKEIIEEIEDLKNIQFYFITDFPMSTLKEFSKTLGLAKCPNIKIGIDEDQFLRKYFEISAIPYTAIYGKDKKLNNAFVGKISSNQIKRIAEE